MHLHLDFETRSACDLKASGLHVYAAHPTTEIMCVGWALGDDPVSVNLPAHTFLLEEVMDHVASGKPVVCHNAAFELTIWAEVGVKRHGWPELRVEQCLDTMIMAYAMSLPGSLEKAAAAVGITEQKDLKGGRVMMQLSQPRDVLNDGTIVWWEDSAKFQTLLDYCAQDVRVERELFKRLVPIPSFEQELWILDQKINNRGVQVDIKAVKTAIDLANLERARLDLEMRRVTGNQVPGCTAIADLKRWLNFRGVPVDGIAKDDVLTLLQQELPDDCRQALRLRQDAAKTSVKKLEAMLLGAGSDGRVRGMFQFHAAGTGRWGGRRVQLQNLSRPLLLKNDEIDSILNQLGGF